MSDPSQPLDPDEGAPQVTAEAPADATVTAEGAVAKADLTKRFLALLIDAAVAVVLSRIPWLGGILAGLYLLFRDGFDFDFMDQRSLGKRILRLRPLCDDGRPVTLEVSARRNWPLAVSSLAVVLLLIPILGWVLIPLVWVVGLLLVLLEGYLAITDPEGRRWGDRLARTHVVETDA